MPVWAILAISYLLGSLPFGIWVGRIFLGRDIRSGGSGHTGATNTIRQAGWGAGLLVALLDVSKGLAAGLIALRFGLEPWALTAAMAGAVAGHCWPVFARFRGGMGLSALGGVMLVVYPLGFAIGLCLAIAGLLVFRHGARGSVVAGIIYGPILWLVTQDITIAAAGLVGGLLVALRFMADWGRKYRELWLDREKPAGA